MDELLLKCPVCGSNQRHMVIRFKEKGLAIVKCSQCGALHHAKPDQKDSGIMLMISRDGLTEKVSKKFAKTKIFKIGEILEFKKSRYEVRSIEDHEGGHSTKLRASEARNVYMVPYTKKISVSVHEADGTTKAYKIELPKDQVIKLRDKIKLGKRKAEVIRLSSLSGETKKSKAGGILALTAKPSK